MIFHTCSGKMSGGRSCWYQASLARKGRWWCRLHDPERPRQQQSRKPRRILVKELKQIRNMIRHYEQHGSLGKEVNFEDLWFTIVPRLLEEIYRLRKLKN